MTNTSFSNPPLDYLDRGEREAIALAEEMRADRLSLDETTGGEKRRGGTYRSLGRSRFCGERRS